MEQSQNTSFRKYAAIIFDKGINKVLDYGILPLQESQIQPGMQVHVPIKGKLRVGYVLAIKEKTSLPFVHPLHSIVSESILIPQDLLELALWIQRYYGSSLKQVLKTILPASVRKNVSQKKQFYITRAKNKESLRTACRELRLKNSPQAKILDVLLKAKKGILLTQLMEEAGVSRSPIDTLVKKKFLLMQNISIERSPLIGEEYFPTVPKPLNADQKNAYDKITSALSKGIFETHLLYGVTGSGKTEVYLQIVAKALSLNLSTIMLVPEISLTTQIIESFRSRFGEEVSLLHHRLNEGERYDQWHRIRSGKTKIVIGVRSALFSPVTNLGLIIVDEEHESAYKQTEESPCYHARNTAIMRGMLSQSVVVLGSATPSVESFYNAQKGKYILSKLSSRVGSAKLPQITLVNMRGKPSLFSEPLLQAIKKKVSLGEQVILFLNRRGYYQSLRCKKCGYIFQCPHCALAMTFHLGDKTLSCHLCDKKLSPPPSTCLQCHSIEALHYRGYGTEQVERALHAIFPKIRTLRMDGDTTRHKGSHERLFREFKTGKADVLIGTQMIAKGVHFPSVSLVAVVNSDNGLHIPDFRSSEHTFQLITQVAGRAGRGHLPGQVIIQTVMPENNTIQMAKKQDYESFYHQEIITRKCFTFPPYTHLVKFVFSSTEQQQAQQMALFLWKKMIASLSSKYIFHPVIACGYSKIKDLYRFQFIIRGPSAYPITEQAQKLLNQFPLPHTLRLLIDVDPLSTFF